MDSVTQAALGAAVGYACLGRKLGRKSLVWGAVAGTLPDLDVVVPYADAVARFTYHRSFSHALAVLALLSPLLAWLGRCWGGQAVSFSRWMLSIYLIFVTHILLDSLTVYGTQILWPFSDYPVSVGSIFIIDPAYTLPILLAVVLALFRPWSQKRWRLNNAMLALSSLYLMWSMGAQFYVTERARTELAAQGVEYSQLKALPAPFNTVLWRVLVMDGQGGHYEGFYSLFDGDQAIEFNHISGLSSLPPMVQNSWPVQRLMRFTHGYYQIREEAGELVVTDLRMGLLGSYVFSFKVGEHDGRQWQPVPSQALARERGRDLFRPLWQRIFNPRQVLPQPAPSVNGLSMD